MGLTFQRRNLPETAVQTATATAAPEAAIIAVPTVDITAAPEAAIEDSEAAITAVPGAVIIITIITIITAQGTAGAKMNSGSRQTRAKPYGLSFLNQKGKSVQKVLSDKGGTGLRY